MIAIIKGCGSNIASIQYACERIGMKSILTADPKIITSASHVILPGVGHAKNAMNFLAKNNLISVLLNLSQPVLGICLGMQLFYESSAEGTVNCLGIIPGRIEKLIATEQQRIPHMGWNNVILSDQTNPVFNKIDPKKQVYFVHSYAAPINSYTIATTHHTRYFTAIVQYKNYIGMQFHPERSGVTGEQLLLNFCNYSTHTATASILMRFFEKK